MIVSAIFLWEKPVPPFLAFFSMGMVTVNWWKGRRSPRQFARGWPIVSSYTTSQLAIGIWHNVQHQQPAWSWACSEFCPVKSLLHDIIGDKKVRVPINGINIIMLTSGERLHLVIIGVSMVIDSRKAPRSVASHNGSRNILSVCSTTVQQVQDWIKSTSYHLMLYIWLNIIDGPSVQSHPG